MLVFFTVAIGGSCVFVSTAATVSRSTVTLVTEGEEFASETTGTEGSTIGIADVVTALPLTANSTLVLTDCSVGKIECSLTIFSSTLRCSFLEKKNVTLFRKYSYRDTSFQINVTGNYLGTTT